jgi:hypothetical protein
MRSCGFRCTSANETGRRQVAALSEIAEDTELMGDGNDMGRAPTLAGSAEPPAIIISSHFHADCRWRDVMRGDYSWPQ